MGSGACHLDSEAVAAAMLAAQQRRQRLTQAGQTSPFRISAKRGPADKATPATNSTPTPTPGQKHLKSSTEDSEMLRSSKKSLFKEAEDDEKSSNSYLPAIT